jgi:hypothetical protein
MAHASDRAIPNPARSCPPIEFCPWDACGAQATLRVQIAGHLILHVGNPVTGEAASLSATRGNTSSDGRPMILCC